MYAPFQNLIGRGHSTCFTLVVRTDSSINKDKIVQIPTAIKCKYANVGFDKLLTANMITFNTGEENESSCLSGEHSHIHVFPWGLPPPYVTLHTE